MNIFVLDTNNIQHCATYHNDRHCVKMILETTQLLNNALIANDKSYTPVYKPSHQNHPCSIWAGKSYANFDWLTELGLALCSEYTYRYNKIHKCQSIIENIKHSNRRVSIRNIGLTDFPKCMPDQYKVDDIVESYRNYYIGEKRKLATWKNRSVPYWWK